MLTVLKAPGPVSLGNLVQTYDGAPHVVSVTTYPVGLAVVVTYDGSTAAPVGAGNYAVEATIQDADYMGSTNGTLTIQKALAPVALSRLAQQYDGTPRVVGASAHPEWLSLNIAAGGRTLSGKAVLNAFAVVPAGTVAVNGTLNGGIVSDRLIVNGGGQVNTVQ